MCLCNVICMSCEIYIFIYCNSWSTSFLLCTQLLSYHTKSIHAFLSQQNRFALCECVWVKSSRSLIIKIGIVSFIFCNVSHLFTDAAAATAGGGCCWDVIRMQIFKFCRFIKIVNEVFFSIFLTLFFKKQFSFLADACRFHS